MSRAAALNKDQLAKIAKSLEGGKTLEHLAMIWKVSRPTLVNNLKRAGYKHLTISKSPYQKRMTEEQLALAKKMMADGETQAEAARAIGFRPQTLCAALNGKVRGPRNVRIRPKERLSDMVRNPELQADIRLNTKFLTTLQLRVGS